MSLGKVQKIGLGLLAIFGLSAGGWLIYTNTINQTPSGVPFVDSAGRMVYVPEHPTRIISIAPSITEILFAIGADDRLVGVTNYCNSPPEAATKTKIGGFTTPNLELITSLNPDLIIVAKYDAEKIESLERTGAPVVVILEQTVDDILNNIEKIGKLVDSEQNATTLVSDLTTRMNAVIAKTSTLTEAERLKCYYEVYSTPKAAGTLSFQSDLLKKAGAINIFGESYPNTAFTWITVSSEVIISRNPDVIFWAPMSRTGYDGYADISTRQGYSNINAVINGRIYKADDDLFSRAGPNIIEALEVAAQLLYPSLFP